MQIIDTPEGRALEHEGEEFPLPALPRDATLHAYTTPNGLWASAQMPGQPRELYPGSGAEYLGELALPADPAARLEARKEALRDAVRDRRWRAEQRGVELDGLRLRTDERSQQRVTSLVTAIVADEQADNFDFEAQPGQWITVTREEGVAIGKALSQHVQACFSHCKTLHAHIDAAEDDDALEGINIQAGWPGGDL
ncbi:MAG: DUF4376 domain-containing protein [Halomonas sp.]